MAAGWAWRRIITAHSPTNSVTSGIAYDEANGYVLLFGGFSGSEVQQTWKFSGTDWTQLTPVTQPSARSYPAMAYVPGIGVVLFGGGDLGNLNLKQDMWWWNHSGNTWVQLTPAHKPSPRYESAMVYSPFESKLILVSGIDNGTGTPQFTEPGGGGTFPTDTWAYSSGDWTQLSTTPSDPGYGGVTHALTKDANGQARLFALQTAVGNSLRLRILSGTTYTSADIVSGADRVDVGAAWHANKNVSMILRRSNISTSETSIENGAGYDTFNTTNSWSGTTRPHLAVSAAPNGNIIYLQQDGTTHELYWRSASNHVFFM